MLTACGHHMSLSSNITACGHRMSLSSNITACGHRMSLHSNITACGHRISLHSNITACGHRISQFSNINRVAYQFHHGPSTLEPHTMNIKSDASRALSTPGLLCPVPTRACFICCTSQGKRCEAVNSL